MQAQKGDAIYGVSTVGKTQIFRSRESLRVWVYPWGVPLLFYIMGAVSFMLEEIVWYGC